MMHSIMKHLQRFIGLVLAVIWLLLGCNMPQRIGLSATSTPSQTPTPTLTPSPTPTPTPEPSARIEVGERALFNGEWERAQQAFQTALGQAVEPDDRAEAQLRIGAAWVEAGRFEQAEEALTIYIDNYPQHEALGQGHFLRAKARSALGRYAEAAQDYQIYLDQRPGLIDSYVHELRGDALVLAGQNAAAREAFRAASDAPRLADDLSLSIKIGRALEASGEYQAALDQYLELYTRSSDASVKAQMDYRLGQVYTMLGQMDQAYMRYLDAVTNFPEVYSSYLGLVVLVEDGVAVDELQRGLVDYFAGQYGVALAAFDRYLSNFPEQHDGIVHYYRGLTLRALGNSQAAVEEWNTLIADHPDDPLWDEAWEEQAYTLWAYLDQYDLALASLLEFVLAAPDHPRAAEFLFDAGRVNERMDELDGAAEIWVRVADTYPESSYTYRALFLAGIARYRLGQPDLSAALFQRSLAHVSEAAERAASYLWIGKSKLLQGDQEAAEAAWSLASEADRGGYYSLRAEELLQAGEPFAGEGVYSFSRDLDVERLEAESWLRSTFPIAGPEPLRDLDPQLQNDPRLVRGKELWALGLYEMARDELDALRFDYENDAEATYRLMHTFLDMGLYRSAIYASRQIMHLAGMDESATWHAPDYLSAIRFGPYFGELILPEALNHGFDGLFLMSVVRQESLFEGFATSYAAARGLMQIIPSTGQYIADQLAWPPDYTADDLYRPVVSVRLGTQYLAEQRELFDGDLYAALSAYNAGPGNALQWKGLAPDDPDLYLEIIRLGQPQDYIRVIYWAYAHYRDLYVSPDSQ